MTEHLIAELARIAGAGHHDRNPAEPPDGEAEPLQLAHRGLRWGRHHEARQNVPRAGALDADIVELVGRGLHPDLQPVLAGELAQMDPAIVLAADPAEVVLPEAEHGPVVDHAAVLVAHGRIDHLVDGELLDVARDGELHQRLGVRADHLELAQGRQVHDRDPLAAGPVFGDRPLVRVAVREPEPAIFGELAGERGGARVEPGFAGQPGLGVGRHAVRYAFGEVFRLVVDADMDVRRRPAIGGIDVVGAGRRGADQVGQRPEQNVVAGPRPGLVHADGVVGPDEGVVEEVDRRPAGARRDPVGLQRAVEVLGAVVMPRIPHVLVVFRRAGEQEGVVPADRVAHDLHQRRHPRVEIFGVQPGARIGRPHQGAGDGRIEAELLAALEGGGVERQEVRALPSVDVNDLDVVARRHPIGGSGGRPDPQVKLRLRQRRRRYALGRSVAFDLDLQVGRRGLLVRVHRAARGNDGAERLSGHLEAALRPGLRVCAEEPEAHDALRIDAAGGERGPGGAPRLGVLSADRLESGVARKRVRAQEQQAGLTALRIDHAAAVSGREVEHQRLAAAGHQAGGAPRSTIGHSVHDHSP